MAGNQVCVIEVTDLVELPTCSPASNVKRSSSGTGERAFATRSPILENWEAVNSEQSHYVDYQRLPWNESP